MFIFGFMMLSCIYLGHSGKTVLISDLTFETKSGKGAPTGVYRYISGIEGFKRGGN